MEPPSLILHRSRTLDYIHQVPWIGPNDMSGGFGIDPVTPMGFGLLLLRRSLQRDDCLGQTATS